jgi:propanol-preferring alcohol dehydrogenase
MKAMRIHAVGRRLSLDEVPMPEPGPGQLLLEVLACGVCRTDLHVLDGELPNLRFPLTPGHEIVARVMRAARDVTAVRHGDRVGVPWLAWTCGSCAYCKRGQDNLCERALFTGYTVPGGYAQFVVAEAAACLPLPARYSDVEAAPLLCAGLIGYRAYRTAGDGAKLGLYGFGAAAHVLAQVARAEGREIYAFTKPGDVAGQAFARELGAVWAGASGESPPAELDAAIIFAAVGALVPAALAKAAASSAPAST